MNGYRRVYISERDFMGRVSIALIGRQADNRFVDHYDPKTKKWQRLPYGYASSLDDVPGPTLDLDGEDAVELYLELYKFMSARGIKNKHESFMEGELTGTKKHLADMRYLLKLPGVIPAPKEGAA